MRRRRDGWTPAEDDTLRAMWLDPGKARAEVALRLGRTVDACASRASYLGLRGRRAAQRQPALLPPHCPFCGEPVQRLQLRRLSQEQLARVVDAARAEMQARGQTRLRGQRG